MPNLRVTQAANTIDGSGQNSTVQTGLVTAQIVAASIQGVTPSSYAWLLSVPTTSSTASLSSATAAAPTFTPDVAGDYLLALNGLYTLPLNVTATVPNEYVGPVVPAFLTSLQAPVPAQGMSVVSDSANQGSLLTTDHNGNHAPILLARFGTTGARPTSPAIGLYVGFTYYDTTLGKPIWWNGTVWKDATGSTV
jgi:hypothetical protein